MSRHVKASRIVNAGLLAVLGAAPGCDWIGGPSSDSGTPSTGTDDTPPSVVSTVPAADATGVAKTVAVSVTFDDALDCATVTTASFVLARKSDGAVVPGTLACADDTASLTPPFPLASLTTFVVRLTTAIRDDAGNSLAADFRWDFTTGGTETTPPTIVSVTPPAGATQVPLDQIIEVLFSEAIDCTTIRTDPTSDPGGPTFYVTHDPTVPIAATVVCVGALARLVTASPLQPNTTYDVGVSGAIQDLAGNSFAGFGWRFTTGNGTPWGSITVVPEPGYTSPPAAISPFVPNQAPTVRTGQSCSLASSGGITTCTQVWWTETITVPTVLEKTFYVWFEPVTGEVSRVEYQYTPTGDFSWAWWRLPSTEPITAVVVDQAAGHVAITDQVMAPSTRPVGSNPPPVHVDGVLLYR